MSSQQEQMTVCPVVYPYVCTKDFTANLSDGPQLILKAGDEGYVFRYKDSGIFRRLKVSINGKAGFHYVTDACVKIGTVPAGDITTRSLDPTVGQVSMAAVAGGENTLIDKIFIGFLTAIRLQMLDSLPDEHSQVLSTSTLCAKMKRQIVSGIPKKLTSLLQSNSFSKQDLWKLGQDENNYAESDAVVYARMYVKEDEHLFYIGHSLRAEARNHEHKSDAKRGEGYHYSHVKGYEQCRIVKLASLPHEKSILMTGEQLFVMLFGNWPHAILQPKVDLTTPALDANDEDKSSQIQKLVQNSIRKASSNYKADAMAFNGIAKDIWEQTGWKSTSDRLGMKPCNWSSPLTETSYGDKTLWIKTTLPGVMEQFRRPPLHLSKNTLSFHVSDEISFKVPKFLDPINLKGGTIVHIVCEIMLNKQPHPRQHPRLPTIGPFEDWEDTRGFGIRVEWQNPAGGWSFAYLSTQNTQSTVKNYPLVLSAYKKASGMVAGLRRIIYTNPQPWRDNRLYRIKEATFDHLTQTIRFRDLVQTKEVPAPALIDKELLRKELVDKYHFNVALPNTVQFLRKTDKYVGLCDACVAASLGKSHAVTCSMDSPCSRCARKGLPCNYSNETQWVKTIRTKCDTCFIEDSRLPCKAAVGSDQCKLCQLYNRPCTSTIKNEDLDAGRSALLFLGAGEHIVEHVEGDIEFAWFDDAGSEDEDEGSGDDDEEDRFAGEMEEDVEMEDA